MLQCDEAWKKLLGMPESYREFSSLPMEKNSSQD